MTPLVEIKFGSHLYGTATPASDLDLKGVHLPDARSILLGRIRAVVVRKTNADNATRNTANDIDRESFTLQKFLQLAAEGQTAAMDMLFAPTWALTCAPSPIWLEIQANIPRLLTRRFTSFVGYCRTQANRYGIRGSRVAAARSALSLLSEAVERHGANAKLVVASDAVEAMAAVTEHMALVDIPNQAGDTLRHWEVCDRKMPYTASLKFAHALMDRVVAEYGHRALAAETNNGVDWKAVSHAVRIARQAIELLETGSVVFPRPDAEHLLAIKMGRLPYRDVADEIDALLPEIEAAADRSTLPDAPDMAWIDNFVAEHYRRVVAAA
jgi:hypothetical protein